MDLGALLVHLLHDVSYQHNNILFLDGQDAAVFFIRLVLLEASYPNEDL